MSIAKQVIIGDKPLVCPHCEGSEFTRREAQLHTAALTFFNMEWLNKSATVFHCAGCGRLEWFLDLSEKKIDPSNQLAGTPWENNPDHTTR